MATFTSSIPQVKLPFQNIADLPPRAQYEIRRDFEEVVQHLSGASTVFDAIIDAAAPNNPALHIYTNLTNLVAGETLLATRLFTVGVVTRLNTTIVETANLTLAGPVALIATGFGDTGSIVNTPTQLQNRQRWDLAGHTVNASGFWLSVFNIQIESTATPISGLPFPNSNVYLNGCNVVGQDPVTSSTQRFSQIAGGRLFAVGTSFVDSQASGNRSFLVGCTYNFHNNTGTAWQPGLHGDYYFTGGFISQSFSNGGITIATGNRVYIDAEMAVFAANQEGSASLAVSITSADATWINLRGNSATWLTDLTIGAGAGNCHVEGNVWHSVLISGNTNNRERFFDGTIAPSGASPTGLDVTGPATVTASMLSTANAAGVAIVRGAGVKLDLHIRPSSNAGLQLIAATDSEIVCNFAPPSGSGFKAYSIDSSSARCVLLLAGSKNANFSVASTNAGTSCLVINESSIVPTDTLWINVKDHGAVGNGIADDTAAISAALTAANWPTSKAVLYFPPGDYLISSSITLDGGGASSTPQIVLLGWGATITTTSVITMFVVTNSTTSITRVKFEGLLIKPNATGATGISFNNAEFCNVVNCEFLGSGGIAINFTAGTCNYVGIYDCTFSNLASGIIFTAPAHFTTIANCNFAEGLAGTGITCWVDVPTSAGISNGVRINGCVFRGVAATKPVVNVIAGVNWTITGNAFFDCPQEAIWLGTNGNAKNIAITGCTFLKGLQNDITINGGRLNSITGCLFGNRGTGVAASTFCNIRIKNTFGGAAGANNVVTGCSSEDTGTALLAFAQLDSGCVSCSFIGNTYTIAISAGTSAPVIIDPSLVNIPINVDISVIGQGLKVKEGTNAKQGIATMAAGTVVVGNTSVTANSRILLTVQVLGTVVAPKAVAVTARTAGTSFTITSSDATDTSQVAWEIIEPG